MNRNLFAVIFLSAFFARAGFAADYQYQINWRAMDLGGGIRSSASELQDSLVWGPVKKSQNAWYALQPGFVFVKTVSLSTPAVQSATHPDQVNEYADASPVFTVAEAGGYADIAGYRYIFDQSSGTIPTYLTALYAPAGTSISLSDKPDGAWYLHAAAEDYEGIQGAFTAHYKVNIKTAVVPASSGTYITGSGARVDIPAGAVEAQTNISIMQPAESQIPRGVYDPNLTGFVGPVEEIKFTSPAELLDDVIITLPYTHAQLNGIDENTLVLTQYDATIRSWRPVVGSAPDKTANKVAGTVGHFSLFRIAGYNPVSVNAVDLSNYPNPFTAGAGGATKIRYSLSGNANVEIKIYDLLGNLVWKKTISAGEFPGGATGPNEIPWDGKNWKGRYVSAGGYICVVKTGGGAQKTKIGVK
ncbi:MAG: T9SS type A sorting domain-containing protein [Elusimicrobia bacterium]|nr:T9SS type A sorting domain-containing protein [Elusimicrobiota bacterium]